MSGDRLGTGTVALRLARDGLAVIVNYVGNVAFSGDPEIATALIKSPRPAGTPECIVIEPAPGGPAQPKTQ